MNHVSRHFFFFFFFFFFYELRPDHVDFDMKHISQFNKQHGLITKLSLISCKIFRLSQESNTLCDPLQMQECIRSLSECGQSLSCSRSKAAFIFSAFRQQPFNISTFV